jgi:hypothetical protein
MQLYANHQLHANHFAVGQDMGRDAALLGTKGNLIQWQGAYECNANLAFESDCLTLVCIQVHHEYALLAVQLGTRQLWLDG